jgi:FKBP-type peptidyl-prolyl cis-trans isomerase FklB
MRNGLNVAWALCLGVGLLQLTAGAQSQQPANAAAPRPAATNAAPKLSPEQEKENMSYAIGMNIGSSIKRGLVDLNVDTLSGAIKDVLAGRTTKLTEREAQESLRSYQMAARAKHEQQMKEQAETNKKAGAAFLAENKTKPGVKTHDVKLDDGTTAEMEYKIIKEGTGATPKTNDTVEVTYKGTLIDGKEFDSSAKHGGQPAKFQANRVIRGWTEALEMMKVGSKWELYLPSSLAYGDRGGPGIEPGSTLIFEVELLGIETPKPTPPAQPLTSDIIRVPSADELKKGAKIEVIKPEDLEKYTNAAAKKDSAEKK